MLVADSANVLCAAHGNADDKRALSQLGRVLRPRGAGFWQLRVLVIFRFSWAGNFFVFHSHRHRPA